MHRALIAAVLLAGCDDTVFKSQEVGYEPDWLGVQIFMVDHCTQCHPSIAEPEWPEALEEDILSGEHDYVTPGSPEDSMIWRVISPAEQVPGDPPKMPQGTGPLPLPLTEHVREWIEMGAPL